MSHPFVKLVPLLTFFSLLKLPDLNLRCVPPLSLSVSVRVESLQPPVRTEFKPKYTVGLPRYFIL